MIISSFPRFSRNFLLAFLPGILLFLGVSQARPAYAQAGTEINLTARIGFDGYCKAGKWLPIRVEIQNTGPDLNATVQVGYENAQGGKTTTSTEVLLPTNSRKEFFLYIYPETRSRSMNVSLLAKNRVLKKTALAVTCISSDNLLFGVLADDPSPYDVLSEVKPLKGFTRVAQLSVSDLPANAQAWSALDALVISNVDTGKLTPEQKQAMEIWLGNGGKLLVTGGLKWQATAAGLKDFLPVEPNATVTVNELSELQAYVKDPAPLERETVLATGKLQTGTTILVEQDGTPILVQKQMGLGSVYYFAADPALQPLNNWSGLKNLYDSLLGFKIPTPSWGNGESFGYYEVNQALATIPELGLPSILYICGLLFFYILIIGPLNYFVLRRLKRQELAWFTIPVLVVIFTGLSYSTGLLYRGRTPILNRLAVVQAWDGVDQAHVRAMVGIYSPVRAKYDLEATEHFMMTPLQDGIANLQSSSDWEALQQDTGMVLPDVRVEIGGMKTVAFEGSLPALAISHDLVITLDQGKPMLKGTIHNQSSHSLKEAFIVTPGQWSKLGDLNAGASRKINISLASGANGPEFYNLGPMDILGMNYPSFDTDEKLARRSSFLQAVLSSQYGMNEGNWGIYLMGWIDEDMLPIGLQNQRFKTIDTLLYVDMLSPALELGRSQVTLPASLFAWEASEPQVSPHYVAGLPQGGYTLRFRPAFALEYRDIESLQFSFQSNAAPSEIDASVWNYEQGDWDAIQVSGRQTVIPEPERYVGPGNEVRIRIVSRRSDWTEITASYITLVVQP